MIIGTHSLKNKDLGYYPTVCFRRSLGFAMLDQDEFPGLEYSKGESHCFGYGPGLQLQLFLNYVFAEARLSHIQNGCNNSASQNCCEQPGT